jgi:polysaccharide deacetylase family protein (PEP-CTERM system associated)
MLNAMTIDVEDYFHTEAMSEIVNRDQWTNMPSRVQQNTEKLFELFAQHNVTATMFFLGWIAERFPGLVSQAVKLGHEVACHSYWHCAVFRLTPEEFREDTHRAKDAIESAANSAVKGYRAPSFSLTPGTEWAPDILAELGFTYDSSINPIAHDFYSNAGAPRVPHRIAQGSLLEIPIATARLGGRTVCVGGGAYFRIFPLCYSTWGLSCVNEEENRPAMFYLHPWEIDPHQPRLNVKLKSKLRQYTRLGSTYGKLEKLLEQYKFGTTRHAFVEHRPLEIALQR